jgi:tripartite-type tricarboxylate transporter receptor subunit TctC
MFASRTKLTNKTGGVKLAMIRGVLNRRAFVGIGVVASAGVLCGKPKLAQAAEAAKNFPEHPINFIIPYGPGGTFDTLVREFSKLLPKYLPKSVSVEPLNVPGAAGTEAIFQLYHDRPDGYNISLVNVPGIFMQQANAAFNVDKLTWICNLARDTYGLAVGTKTGVNSIADLQALSKKRQLLFSSTGHGSTDYLATKVLAAALGLNVRLIAGYEGSSSSGVGVARGDVDAVVHSLASLEKMQEAGLVKVIFVYQDKSPIPGVEDATTINQPDLGNIFQWRPVAAPPGLPAGISSILTKSLIAAANSPEAKDWAEKVKVTLDPLDQAQTIAMLQTQEKLVNKWKSVL